MSNPMPKHQWIEEVYALLCKSQGAPENNDEIKHLHDWATRLAESPTDMWSEGMTPQEAHDEELSNA